MITNKLLAAPLAAAVVAGLMPAETSPDNRSAGSDRVWDVALTSTQVALVMNGTFEPVVTDAWIEQVMADLLTPVLGDGYTGAPMTTPEEFWPITGLGSLTFNKSIKVGHELLSAQVRQELAGAPRTPLAVFGYSQSAIIAAVEKRNLQDEYGSRKDLPPVNFTMIGNPLRPNGGFLSRLPIVAAVLTPWTDMYDTPTDTRFATYDIARQYDMWADFPAYPLNLLSTINALFGLWNHWYLPESIHDPFMNSVIPTVSLDPDSPDYNPDTVVQTFGDTTHYLIPSPNLPMFYPLRWIGLGPLVDIIEPMVRVFVELGYDRTSPYGEVVRARMIPGLDNLTLSNIATFVSDVDAALRMGFEALVRLVVPASPPEAAVTALPAAGVTSVADPALRLQPAVTVPASEPAISSHPEPVASRADALSTPPVRGAVQNPAATPTAAETATSDIDADEESAVTSGRVGIPSEPETTPDASDPVDFDASEDPAETPEIDQEPAGDVPESITDGPVTGSGAGTVADVDREPSGKPYESASESTDPKPTKSPRAARSAHRSIERN